MAFEEGAKAVRVVGRKVNFYEDYLATNLYVERVLGGMMNSLTVSNDSETDEISISFDGATLEAELRPEESLTINIAGIVGVYVKGDVGGGNVRLWGW